MSPLTALLLSDGRPGHYHRADGILAAIARKRPVNAVRIDVKRRRWLPGKLLAVLANAGLAPARLLQLAYGIDSERFAGADLVVSAGGDTLAGNVAAAKLLGAPNIFYGSIRRFKPDLFSLVLTSYAGHATQARHRMTPLMPVPQDPDKFPLASGAPLGPQRPPRIAGLLIGGDAGTVRYEWPEWQRLLSFMSALNISHGTRWIVSNSRRTPAEVGHAVARLAREASSPIAAFIDVQEQGPGSLDRLFAGSEAVICTADSSSMITESIWLRRPTIAVAPRRSGFQQGEDWYRRHLAEHGWVRTIPIADLTPERLLVALSDIAPLAENPLDVLAADIADYLPALFSPQVGADDR